MDTSDHSRDNDVSGPTGPYGEGWGWRMVVALVAMCLVLDILAMSYIFMAILLPDVAAQYNTTQGVWMPTGFLIAGAVFSPLIGKLADAHGKRKLLLACMLCGALGAIIAALAPTIGILIVGCTLMGLLNPCVFLVYTLINDVFPARTVAMSVSITTSSMGLAAVPAPFIVGWLLDAFGIHSAFWFICAVLLVLLPIILFVTAESDQRWKTRLDFIGAILLGTGIAGVLVGISFAPRWGWIAPSTLAYFFGGLALCVAWIISAGKIKQPLVDLSLLKSRAVAVIVFVTGMAFAVGAVYSLVLPYMAMTPRDLGLGYGFGASGIGYAIIQAPFAFCTFIGGVIAGSVVTRVGPRVTMLAGFLVMVVGTVLTGISHDDKVLVMVLAAVIGIGTGFAYASVPNLILTFVRQSSQATAGALANVFQALIPAIMGVVTYAVLNGHIATELSGKPMYSNAGITLGFLVAAIVAIIGFVVTLILPRIRRAAVSADSA